MVGRWTSRFWLFPRNVLRLRLAVAVEVGVDVALRSVAGGTGVGIVETIEEATEEEDIEDEVAVVARRREGDLPSALAGDRALDPNVVVLEIVLSLVTIKRANPVHPANPNPNQSQNQSQNPRAHLGHDRDRSQSRRVPQNPEVAAGRRGEKKPQQ